MGLCLLAATSAIAAEKPAAVIVSPKAKQEVERTAELTGKALIRGWPVVVVRPEQGDATWWVQDPVVVKQPGYFQAPLIFGNENTVVGTKFRVVVLMLQSAEEAKKFTPGQELKSLPEAAPRSAEIVVTRGAEKETAVAVEDVELTLPQDGRVNRIEEICGRVPEAECHPVVLVRSDSPNDAWWVQLSDKPNKEGKFVARAHFGNDTTPEGTPFRMVVLLVDKNAAGYEAGTSLKQLPPGIKRSKEVRVVRQRIGQVPTTTIQVD